MKILDRFRFDLSVAATVSLVLAGGVVGAGRAEAAGFYIQEQGVSGLGRAYAGDAAVASDASTIYFNPAGMTYLSGPEFQGNGSQGSIILKSAKRHRRAAWSGTVNCLRSRRSKWPLSG